MSQQVQSPHIPRRVITLALSCSFVLAGCGDDGVLNSTPQPPKGIVVLDGYIQPGLTLLADTGSASARITFGPTTEFDAGGFTLRNDTVLAVSSRGAGDLLYIADVRTGSMRRLQMPARSNPGSARLLVGANGQALVGVALRDSGSVALVSVSRNGSSTSTRLGNAGRCPTDLLQYGNAVWVVDANSDCRTNYAELGDVRLIRIPNDGSARDTITIPGMRGSGASIVASGDVAYVSAGGQADFGAFPYTLLTSGSVARIDLVNRRVLTQRAMPASSYGASTSLGADGFLYVSLYQDLDAFQDRVIKLTADLTIVGAAAEPWLGLQDGSGQPVTCGNATADALGRVHCLITGAGSATSLLVFDPAGREIRRVAAGQGGVDLALR